MTHRIVHFSIRLQNLFGARDNTSGDSGQPRHLDTIAAVGTAFNQFAQKDDLVIPFLNGNVVVFHPGTPVRPDRSIRGNGWQKRFDAPPGKIVQKFGHRPGDAHAVKVLVPRPISSRITRLRPVALCRILAVSCISTIKVLCPWERLSRAPTRVKIWSTMGTEALPAGYEGPHLRHHHRKGGLAQDRGFAGHIGPGDDQDLMVDYIQMNGVGHEPLAGEHLLHHRMAPPFDMRCTPSVLMAGRAK